MEIHLLFLLSYFISSMRFSAQTIPNSHLYAPTIFINLFLILPSFLYFLNPPFSKYFNPIYASLHIFLNYFSYDFLHFSIHRILHLKPIFKYIHKKRHIKDYNCPWLTFYCSPIDFILLDIIPLYSGLIIMNAHKYVYYYFTIIEVYLMGMNMSGKGRRSLFFGMHERLMNCHFGIDLIFDKLFPNL